MFYSIKKQSDKQISTSMVFEKVKLSSELKLKVN